MENIYYIIAFSIGCQTPCPKHGLVVGYSFNQKGLFRSTHCFNSISIIMAAVAVCVSKQIMAPPSARYQLKVEIVFAQLAGMVNQLEDHVIDNPEV